MKQAKVLSEAELKRVLAVVATMRHAERNRAALTMADVLDDAGKVKDRIVLRAATTKSGEARAIFVGEKLGRGRSGRPPSGRSGDRPPPPRRIDRRPG